MNQISYSPEVRKRAVRLVFDQQKEHGSQWSVIKSIEVAPINPYNLKAELNSQGELIKLSQPDELLCIANKLHSVFGYQDSDENAPDYTHQTTESGFALSPSRY